METHLWFVTYQAGNEQAQDRPVVTKDGDINSVRRVLFGEHKLAQLDGLKIYKAVYVGAVVNGL